MQIHDFSAAELSNLLWGAATLGMMDRPALKPALQAVKWKADMMQPQALAQVCACALARSCVNVKLCALSFVSCYFFD